MSNQSDVFKIQFNWKSFGIMFVLFALLLIYITLLGVEDVIQSLFKANIFLLILAIIVYYLSLVIRSFRWKFFIESLDHENDLKISYWSIFSLISFSFALNNLFPLRMGELYRPYELTKKKEVSLISSFATVILERTLDVIIMASLILISATLQGLGTVLNDSNIISNILLSIIIVGIFVFALIILSREKPTFQLVKILNWISKSVQKRIIRDERGTAQKVSTQISLLIRNQKVIFFGLAYGLIIWLMEGLVFWIVSISMKIEISLLMAIFILLLSGLIGNSITSASGLSQLPFMVAQLHLIIGISQYLALSTSIVYLVIVFWIIIPVGVILRELEKVLIKSNFNSKKNKLI